MSAVKHNAGHGVMFGMAESDEGGRYAAFCGKLLGWSRKYEKRFAAGLFANIDVAPAHRFADAGAECFRNGFLRRKPRSQVASWEFHRHRIFNLAVGKDTMKKSITKTVDRMLNARAFDKIGADTDNAHLVRLDCLKQSSSHPVRQSSGIILHRGQHFLHCASQSPPNRARRNRVTDVEFGQIRNLMDDRDIFVIDAVTGVDLEM